MIYSRRSFLPLAIILAFAFQKSFLVVQAKYTLYTFALDEKCNVTFNHDQLAEDEEKLIVTQMQNFDECYAKIFDKKINKLNLTSTERENCMLKCQQIQDGFLNTDGHFNKKFVDKIEKHYEKYSDAKPHYVQKLKALFLDCKSKAETQLKSLKENGNPVAKCELNALFEECLINLPEKNDETELCGTDTSTAKPEPAKDL